jgi:hypothetical protein
MNSLVFSAGLDVNSSRIDAAVELDVLFPEPHAEEGA